MSINVKIINLPFNRWSCHYFQSGQVVPPFFLLYIIVITFPEWKCKKDRRVSKKSEYILVSEYHIEEYKNKSNFSDNIKKAWRHGWQILSRVISVPRGSRRSHETPRILSIGTIAVKTDITNSINKPETKDWDLSVEEQYCASFLIKEEHFRFCNLLWFYIFCIIFVKCKFWVGCMLLELGFIVVYANISGLLFIHNKFWPLKGALTPFESLPIEEGSLLSVGIN